MHTSTNAQRSFGSAIFRLIIVLLVYVLPVVHAFSIETPPFVIVSETTKFNYTWNASDVQNGNNNTRTGIALFDARSPGVGRGQFENEDNKFIRLDANGGNGTVEFAVRRTGTFYLQAYTFENIRGRPQNLQAVHNSSTFDAVLQSPTTVSVTVSVSQTTTPTTQSTSEYASGEQNKEGGHYKRSLSPGATAGIVIGIFAFLFILAGAFIVYRRRRYRKRVTQFHQERMVARSIPPSQVSFWVGDSKSFGGGASVASPRSFGPGMGTSPSSSAPFVERDNFQFPTPDGRLTPLRGAGYSN